MKQLTMGDLMDFAAQVRKEGMPLREFRAMPIYLGDDDELNGIHCAWYTNLVDADNTEDEDNVYTVELINERCGNIELKTGKAILIS